eukprot:521444_1
MTAKRLGKVKYIGELDGKKGRFYGVELWKGEGKNSGSHNGIAYFKCVNPDMAKRAAQQKQQKTPQRKQKAKKKVKKPNKTARNSSKISNKPKAKKTARNSRTISNKPKAKKISNNPKPKTNKSKQTKQKKQTKPSKTTPSKAKKSSIKGRRGSGKRPSLKYQQNKLVTMIEREEKLQIIEADVAALPTREPSGSIMSVRKFKSIPLDSYMTKGDNFDIAKRICKAYDDKFNDTDTVCLVSNTGLRPLYSLCVEGEYKRVAIFDREEKYVLVYRAKAHIGARVTVTKQCFKSVVQGLSIGYENTRDVVNNMNILFGEGCHVVRAKKQSFDIYSRFSDGYECEVRFPESSECVLAWRR